ncbi:MAG TPA: MFS transporter [Oligoflexia bacterium]|nr:MFS transporter [Oligoflexia bacterium]HMR25281.1 MFS transporter [Oligoflexia bacterium]
MKFISHAMTFIIPLLPAFLVQVSALPETTASLLLACIFFVSGCTQIFIGNSFDEGYGKSALIFSFCSALVGILLVMFLYQNLFAIALGAILTIISLDIVSTAILRSLVASAPDHLRGEASAKLYLTHNLGFCCASVLAFYFLESHRLLLFTGDLITTLSMIVLLLFLFNSLKFAPKKQRKSLFTVIDKAWLKRNWSMLSFHYLMYINIFIHAIIIPMIFAKAGINAIKWTTFLLAINTGIVVVLALPITRLTKTWNDKYTILLSCFLFGLAHALVPYYLEPWGIAMTATIGVLGEITCVPPLTNILYRCFKQENMGLASGLKVSLRAISMFSMPLLGLFLFSFFPIHYKPAFSVMCVVLAIITFLLGAVAIHKGQQNLASITN